MPLRSRSIAVLLAVLSVVALGAAACDPQPGGPAGTPTLTKKVVLTGLDHPWDLGFLPDGTLLMTERSGDLSRIQFGKRSFYHPADLVASSEGGMLGLAVDPFYAANRYVYVCFDSNAAGRIDVRVARLRLNANATAVEDRKDIVTGIPWNGGRHSGCRPRFGPDGYLYIGTGDAALMGVSQSLWSLGGKVLRVTRDGAGAPDNIFGSRIFSIGHRNVQGLAFEPGTGRVINVEHGTGRDDEINANVVGGNYGWYSGTTSYEDSTANMTDYVHFRNPIAPIWSSGDPTIAPSGATFVTGSQWKSWNGALAVAVLKGSELMFTFAKAGGNVHDVVYAFQDGYRLRSAVQGPDGHLYVTTDDTGARGQIWEITPS